MSKGSGNPVANFFSKLIESITGKKSSKKTGSKNTKGRKFK